MVQPTIFFKFSSVVFKARSTHSCGGRRTANEWENVNIYTVSRKKVIV